MLNTKIVWFVAMLTSLAIAHQGYQDKPTGGPPPRQKVRVSAGVISGNVLKKVIPDASDLKSVKNGTVKISFAIDESGNVESVLKTEGDPDLQDRCIKAIKGWHFKPYELNGQLVMVESYVFFRFKKGKSSVEFHP